MIDYKTLQKSGVTNVKDATALLKYATCVKKCPSADISTPVLCKKPAFMSGSQKQYYENCVYYIGGTSAVVKKALRYATIPLGGKYCIPDISGSGDVLAKEFTKIFEKYLGQGALSVVQDIVAARFILSGALGSAFLLGFIYMLFLRFCGKILMWISILAIIGGSGYGGWMLY
jgi:hypothetical protein